MMEKRQPKAVVVMGVSGAGKSSVGQRLAERMACPYVEGDSLHPQANIDKMANGNPLTDEDRWPWLDRIGAQLSHARDRGQGVVITCSALKRSYRDRLRAAVGGDLYFVYLDGSPDLLAARMRNREGHFMPGSLLQSQLSTLENPKGEQGVVSVGIDEPVDDIVAAAILQLAKL
ncbi:MAG: gluconokinase [Neorhizobium sp.]|nr:gluconokinase [Neorhizobium sp.]